MVTSHLVGVAEVCGADVGAASRRTSRASSQCLRMIHLMSSRLWPWGAARRRLPMSLPNVSFRVPLFTPHLPVHTNFPYAIWFFHVLPTFIGASVLASATRWGSTPQRVCRRSNHRDLSRTIGVASAHPRLLESLSALLTCIVHQSSQVSFSA